MKEQEFELVMIILAAGNSRRFGSNKLLYKVDDIPMYRRSLELMKKVAKMQGKGLRLRVTMVTQYEEIRKEAEAPGVSVLMNPCPEEGISSSMKIGLQANVDADACLFAVADQPWLKPETVCRLIREYLASEKEIACLSIQDEPGNPCIFSKKYYPELMTLSGDRGGKRVLKAHPEDVLCIRTTDIHELRDLDLPPDVRTNLDFVQYDGVEIK